MNKLPVNLAGANGGMGGAKFDLPSTCSCQFPSAEGNWQEHVDGKSNFAPPIPPLAPAKFTGSLFITSGRNPLPECTTFSSSLENSTGSYVQNRSEERRVGKG